MGLHQVHGDSVPSGRAFLIMQQVSSNTFFEQFVKFNKCSILFYSYYKDSNVNYSENYPNNQIVETPSCAGRMLGTWHSWGLLL